MADPWTECVKCGRRVRILLTDAEKAEILQMYSEGIPLKVIGNKFNISPHHVGAIRARAGITAGRQRTIRHEPAAEGEG